jgi:hypothetical protein
MRSGCVLGQSPVAGGFFIEESSQKVSGGRTLDGMGGDGSFAVSRHDDCEFAEEDTPIIF